MSELCHLSVAEASALIRRREVSPLELTEAHLRRIEALEPALGSYITVNGEVALEQARTATERVARGSVEPMLGIPVSVKDNIETAGVRTTAASRVLQHSVPDADAEVVRRLSAAGAVLIGKAALSEFSFAGGATPEDFVKAPRNPWHLGRSAGGSSNGSAVNVAAGLAMASIGTDAGGSIRIPAAFCGVSGLAPTYGRVPKTGVIPLSYSMGVVGPLARDVRDLAIVLEAIAGHASSDPSSSRRAVDGYERTLATPVGGLRVGTCPTYMQAVGVEAETHRAIDEVVEALKTLGMTAADVEVPHLTYACAAGYQTILRVEAFHHHFERLRDHRAAYGAAFRNIARGGFLTADDYLRAQRARTLISTELREAFTHADVLVLPVTPATPAGGAYAMEGTDEKVRRGTFGHGPAYTVPFNLTGNPSLSIPCGFTAAGMPIAVQFISRPFAEATLLAVAHQYQSTTTWHRRRPPHAP